MEEVFSGMIGLERSPNSVRCYKTCALEMCEFAKGFHSTEFPRLFRMTLKHPCDNIPRS